VKIHDNNKAAAGIGIHSCELVKSCYATLGVAEYHGMCPPSGSHTPFANLRIAQCPTDLISHQPLKQLLYIHKVHLLPQKSSQPWTVSSHSVGRCVFNPFADLFQSGSVRTLFVGRFALGHRRTLIVFQESLLCRKLYSYRTERHFFTTVYETDALHPSP
jgi:hypothetical protein